MPPTLAVPNLPIARSFDAITRRPTSFRRMIKDRVKALAQAKNFAALTTMMPSGQPQTQVMWVHCDDEHILINTEVHRRKFKNVELDPRDRGLPDDAVRGNQHDRMPSGRGNWD